MKLNLIVKKETQMVAEAEVVFQQSLPAALEIELFDGVSSAVKSPVSSPKLGFSQLTTSPVVSLSSPIFRHV